jgi:hypothetical protein
MAVQTTTMHAEMVRVLCHGLVALLVGGGTAAQLILRGILPVAPSVAFALLAATLVVFAAQRLRRPPPGQIGLRTVAHTLLGGGIAGLFFSVSGVAAPHGGNAIPVVAPYACSFAVAAGIGYGVLRVVLRREASNERA